MRVKMLIGAHAGHVQEVPHHVGESLVMMGQAERVTDEPSESAVETATVEAPEHAVSRGARKKK